MRCSENRFARRAVEAKLGSAVKIIAAAGSGRAILGQVQEQARPRLAG